MYRPRCHYPVIRRRIFPQRRILSVRQASRGQESLRQMALVAALLGGSWRGRRHRCVESLAVRAARSSTQALASLPVCEGSRPLQPGPGRPASSRVRGSLPSASVPGSACEWSPQRLALGDTLASGSCALKAYRFPVATVARNRQLSNNALHLTRRGGAVASRPVVEARLAGERECSTGLSPVSL